MVIDYWHCFTSGVKPEEIARMNKDVIYGVHVCDSLPFVMLLPLGIALFKLLTATNSVWWLFLMLGVMGLWVLYRILKSTAVVFDVAPQRVYLIGSAIIVLLIIGVGMFLDTQYGIISYLQYFFNVLKV